MAIKLRGGGGSVHKEPPGPNRVNVKSGLILILKFVQIQSEIKILVLKNPD